MLFSNQGGNGLELPPLDIYVKATGPVYNYSVVKFDPADSNIEYDVQSGRVVLTGVEMASNVDGGRSADVHGVAYDRSAAANTLIASAGERVRVRVIGAIETMVSYSGSVSKGQHLTASSTSGILAVPAANSSDGAAATQGFRIAAFALETKTVSTGNALSAPTIQVAFNGFGWGQDEYTEA